MLKEDKQGKHEVGGARIKKTLWVSLMTSQKDTQFIGDEKLWYQALIQSMNDGFGVIDKNNVFTYVNSRFAQMLE